MRKRKFLIGLLIAGSALSGVAYAQWEDGLTIQTTLSTGRLDVVPISGSITRGCDKQTAYKEEVTPTLGSTHDFEYQIKSLYPGSSYTFEAQFANQGTIPAVLADVHIEINPTMTTNKPGCGEESNLAKQFYITQLEFILNKGTAEAVTKTIDLPDIDDNQAVTLDQLQEKINEALSEASIYLMMEPGKDTTHYNTLDVSGKIYFKPSHGNGVGGGKKYEQGNPYEGARLTFVMDLIFKQHNQITGR